MSYGRVQQALQLSQLLALFIGVRILSLSHLGKNLHRINENETPSEKSQALPSDTHIFTIVG